MAARIGIVGASWRAEYYLRAASVLPEHFEVVAVHVASDASAERVTRTWSVAATTSRAAFLAGDYDFVVVATPSEVAAELTVAASRAGHAVLTETPPAPTRESLLAYYAELRGQRVQVAEQYRFQAHHAARLALAKSGRLGPVTWARLSAAHGYHGVSLIRAFLGKGFDPVTISGYSVPDPTVASRGRDDWHDELVEYTSARAFARLDYGEQNGLYEFDFEQYFSPTRPRHVEVYGPRGQISDDDVSYVVAPRHATVGRLQRSATGADGDLEGFFVDSISWGDDIVWSNPYRGARLNDDELAVAELMGRMARYVDGGPEAYSLADGCHDQLLSLAINEAVESGLPVRVDEVPWADATSVLDDGARA
jgi:predicted dehydrogenase